MKNRFFAGLLLVGQFVAVLVLFAFLYARKRSLPAVLLLLSGAGAAGGVRLMLKHLSEENGDATFEALEEDPLDYTDSYSILTEDDISESEFT